jgi:uncharacterized membrane protein required for colicin V production
MIAAATQSKMLFNWFDVAVVLVLAFGFWRGRKNGMTREILPLFYWLVTVIAAGFGYVLLGDQLIQQGIIKQVFGKSGFKERTAAYISAYLIIVGLVRLAYSFVKKFLKPRLEGSNIFGSTEYYFGMGAGAVRYACIVVFFLALVNAPYFSEADIEAERIYNNRWYGGGVQGYSGNFFPTLSEFQIIVFKDSLMGPTIKRGVRVLLISTEGAVAPTKPPVMEIK